MIYIILMFIILYMYICIFELLNQPMYINIKITNLCTYCTHICMLINKYKNQILRLGPLHPRKFFEFYNKTNKYKKTISSP